MRLLHRDNTKRLTLRYFNEREPIPPYAILSHRWSNDEVLFADMERNGYTKKAGFQKIDFCAERAWQDGLQYFWMDTCCIDKWNPSERSRAINSMFRWYRNAAKCYVFLPDVAVDRETDEVRENAWEASFRSSEWFTRGWTLQELIAPKLVEFFSREGYRIGDKVSLGQLVHEITGVPIDALEGRSLESFENSDLIGWAKGRKTTEPEDGVYCLLGMLNVSMLVLYSEGPEQALSRLSDEMRPGNVTTHSIPFLQNPQFVGRESQLDWLEARLFANILSEADKQTAVLAITGAGGTGKSQLALELAYNMKGKYESCSVF